MKFLFLVADGMGDWPIKALDGKTCLEAAHTPCLDELAGRSVLGRCATIPKGMAPGSDVANMALLGFDPAQYHTGRGPIEAAAQGLALGPDDLVFRLNLVTVSEFSQSGVMLDYSAGHIDTELATKLVARLQARLGGEGFMFLPGVQYRHLLIQQGGALEPSAELAVRPPHDILDQKIKPDLRQISKYAPLWDLVFGAAEVLAENNPTKANAVWPWGQGRPLSLPDFTASYGLRGGVISAVDLIKGLGLASNMDVIDVPGATGLVDTDYEGKVAAALAYLAENDFVFVHLEGPDECGHGGSPECKVTAIERFDQRIVAPLLAGLAERGEAAAVLVCCDHYTPIQERTHTTDPVPFLLHWPGCEGSGAAVFSEKTADASGLRIDAGHKLLPW
ncbi:MAG: cofactor-independent phosphoglycerate mutase, partial [Desulfovibrionaceae bacterium]